MDSSKLMFTGDIRPPDPLEQLGRINGASDEKKKQFAKDFESIFISKMFDEMKKTIVDWGLEKDGASKQMDGIFWMYLAKDIANNGGFGLWKDIYQSLTDTGQKNTMAQSLNKDI